MTEFSNASQSDLEFESDGIFHVSIVKEAFSISNNLMYDGLIEAIWHDLSGFVSYERIRQTAREVADEYDTAKVKTFLSIFIHREVVERLRRSMQSNRNKPTITKWRHRKLI